VNGKAEVPGVVRRLYEIDFRAAHSLWVEEFLGLLLEFRRVFGNDLDKLIIVAAIGQQLLRDRHLPLRSLEEWMGRPLIDRPGRGTNIDALARATGIPRESVRRKVNELLTDGLIFRNDRRMLEIAPGAAARLAGTTEATIIMLDRLVAGYLALANSRPANQAESVSDPSDASR
jgi:hypothetical protein